jgi:hypothetical protein
LVGLLLLPTPTTPLLRASSGAMLEAKNGRKKEKKKLKDNGGVATELLSRSNAFSQHR